MFKELIQDENIPSFDRKPNHGDLTKWADQGVLMLNAVLTGKLLFLITYTNLDF